MFVSITTGALLGLESFLVRVEVDTSPGLPCFQMVGYLSSEVRESRERVRVALKNAGFALPAQCINVNLSPADKRKEGTAYDLPVAIGILCALGELPESGTSDTLIIGELGLDGEVRPVRGILPIVRTAREAGIKKVILPAANASEGSLIPEISVIPVSTLSQACRLLSDPESLSPEPYPASGDILNENTLESGLDSLPDFSEVHGQQAVKRAAMVAAAGFHNMLMIGPPGAGKTMIAKRIPSILPPLSVEEALEVTSIYSVAGLLKDGQALISARPFLSPHHTITEQALAGGGSIPRPGVISLAHRGVLFLDEMTEFARSTLDIMRQPLEDKVVYISRNHGTYRYPADFMLVAACNPCPCGYYPDLNKCHCTENQIRRYLNRISGPLLDRIDICCDVEPVDMCHRPSVSDAHELSSSDMREMIRRARQRQEERFRGRPVRFNSEMSSGEIEEICELGPKEQSMMETAYRTLGLSARSYHRILKVARTIADLDDCDRITEEHLSESLFYRTSGSRFWGR